MNLFPHQIQNATKLVRSINRVGAGIDASDTGTGKSFTAFAVAAALRRKPFIICPKGVGPSWINKTNLLNRKDGSVEKTDASALFGFTGTVEWVNYEKARRSAFRWPDLSDALVVVDEAHRVGAPDTLQSQMIRTLADRGLPLLFLSATPFATPMRTRAFMHACNKVHWSEWYNQLKHFGCYRNQHIKGKPWMWSGSDQSVDHLKLLFKDNMVATRWSEVEGFPDVKVQPEAVLVPDQAKAEALARAVCSNDLGKTTQERKELELLRVPAMVEMAKDLRDQGKHVLGFFNYTEPLHAYAEQCGVPVIDGSTRPAVREEHHKNFQANRLLGLALNSKAGGEGIDLQGPDRVSLISPDYSATTWKQVFGRTHRIGGYLAILKPIFVAGTMEETKVLPSVMAKAQHIETLTEQDLINP